MTGKELVKELYSIKPKFYRLINSYGFDPEDIIHDVCLRLLDSNKDYSDKNITSLFYTIVNNECINQYRSNKRHKRDYDEIKATQVQSENNEYDNFRLFSFIRDHKDLNDRDKFVLYNHFWNDCSYDEIGEMLNTNPITLRTSFLKCKRVLKKDLYQL